MKVNLKQIKLIIWDLDETFLGGVLSENTVIPIEKNIHFVRQLNEYGFVNSICSKNDLEIAKNKLKELNVLDEFVFISINWEPKGYRIKEMLDNMGLRACNVLFIDDNGLNLEEARYYCKDLLVATPGEIEGLIEQLELFSGKKKNRVSQYKLLESKVHDRKEYASNEEFLTSINVRVFLDYNCEQYMDRILELISRTNQLNFTKKRISHEELKRLIRDNDTLTCVVKVADSYGEYGIVGFLALKEQEFVHFLFSCRILGMGIEQYIYDKFDYPQIHIVPEVAVQLQKNMRLKYITEVYDDFDEADQRAVISDTVLLKGPCDLEQIFGFIADSENISTEFTYVSPLLGTVGQLNHTQTIVNVIDYAYEDFENECFVEQKMFQTEMFKRKFHVIFLSILQDANLAVYENKTNGHKIVFGEALFDITDKKNWGCILQGNCYTAGFSFTKEYLKQFSEKYEYIGLISENDFYENLRKIRLNLPKKTILVFMNGTELEFLGNKTEMHSGRHIIHKRLNVILKKICEEFPNTYIFDVNRFVTEQSDYTTSPNHFRREVYGEMAREMIRFLELNGNNSLEFVEAGKAVPDSPINRIKHFIENFILGATAKKRF